MFVSSIKLRSPIIYIKDIKKQYEFNFKRECNLDSPQLFTEKIQWLKVYDSIPEKSICADKVLLRDYSKNILGFNPCPKIYNVYDSPEAIEINALPKTCILKCNHGYNMNLVLNNRTMTADEFDKLKEWYNTDFSLQLYEFHYHKIKHKIFTEELLDIKSEFKVYCFNGSPKYVDCIFYDDFKNTLYKDCAEYKRVWSRHDAIIDLNFNLIDKWQFNVERPNYNEHKYLKHNYKKYFTPEYTNILTIAKQLSQKFKFVRVDFYNTTNDNIYLSEMTFTPSAGYIHLNSIETDYQIGQLLNVNNT